MEQPLLGRWQVRTPPEAPLFMTAELTGYRPPQRHAARILHLHEPPKATLLFAILIPIIAGQVLRATKALCASYNPKLHSGPSNPAVTPLSERRRNLTDTSGARQRPATPSTTPVPPTIVAVFSGMTACDGPPLRGAAAASSTASLLGTSFLAGTALTLCMGEDDSRASTMDRSH